eukprot:TRINITY_DN7660_c5_g1_i1.p1 TRINITY_DN7660_c5_g1~~TRINITY_DN7660_c5_g1_i1.p1  ORF type:complete len:1237 (+),score=192.73 TRINITY_DN7660_c5_g1_i1:123-3833(+)
MAELSGAEASVGAPHNVSEECSAADLRVQLEAEKQRYARLMGWIRKNGSCEFPYDATSSNGGDGATSDITSFEPPHEAEDPSPARVRGMRDPYEEAVRAGSPQSFASVQLGGAWCASPERTVERTVPQSQRGGRCEVVGHVDPAEVLEIMQMESPDSQFDTTLPAGGPVPSPPAGLGKRRTIPQDPPTLEVQRTDAAPIQVSEVRMDESINSPTSRIGQKSGRLSAEPPLAIPPYGAEEEGKPAAAKRSGSARKGKALARKESQNRLAAPTASSAARAEATAERLLPRGSSKHKISNRQKPAAAADDDDAPAATVPTETRDVPPPPALKFRAKNPPMLRSIKSDASMHRHAKDHAPNNSDITGSSGRSALDLRPERPDLRQLSTSATSTSLGSEIIASEMVRTRSVNTTGAASHSGGSELAVWNYERMGEVMGMRSADSSPRVTPRQGWQPAGADAAEIKEPSKSSATSPQCPPQQTSSPTSPMTASLTAGSPSTPLKSALKSSLSPERKHLTPNVSFAPASFPSSPILSEAVGGPPKVVITSGATQRPSVSSSGSLIESPPGVMRLPMPMGPVHRGGRPGARTVEPARQRMGTMPVGTKSPDCEPSANDPDSHPATQEGPSDDVSCVRLPPAEDVADAAEGDVGDVSLVLSPTATEEAMDVADLAAEALAAHAETIGRTRLFSPTAKTSVLAEPYPLFARREGTPKTTPSLAPASPPAEAAAAPRTSPAREGFARSEERLSSPPESGGTSPTSPEAARDVASVRTRVDEQPKTENRVVLDVGGEPLRVDAAREELHRRLAVPTQRREDTFNVVDLHKVMASATVETLSKRYAPTPRKATPRGSRSASNSYYGQTYFACPRSASTSPPQRAVPVAVPRQGGRDSSSGHAPPTAKTESSAARTAPRARLTGRRRTPSPSPHAMRRAVPAAHGNPAAAKPAEDVPHERSHSASGSSSKRKPAVSTLNLSGAADARPLAVFGARQGYEMVGARGALASAAQAPARETPVQADVVTTHTPTVVAPAAASPSPSPAPPARGGGKAVRFGFTTERRGSGSAQFPPPGRHAMPSPSSVYRGPAATVATSQGVYHTTLEGPPSGEPTNHPGRAGGRSVASFSASSQAGSARGSARSKTPPAAPRAHVGPPKDPVSVHSAGLNRARKAVVARKAAEIAASLASQQRVAAHPSRPAGHRSVSPYITRTSAALPLHSIPRNARSPSAPLPPRAMVTPQDQAKGEPSG